MKRSRSSSGLRKASHSSPPSIPWTALVPELLSSIHQNRKEKSESPKAVARYSRYATAGIITTHLLPIAATATLLYINVSNTYFEDPGVPNQNTRLNALQFAAKVHEVLITVSFSAIVLHYIQYELLHGRGVPLGSIFASFQVTNLGTLWSPGLWAIASARVPKARRILVVGITIIALLVGATSGPASAILMVPSLGYQNSSSRFTPDGIYVGANDSMLWPSFISADSFPSWCNTTIGPTTIGPPLENCPLGGLSALLAMRNPDWLAIGRITMPTETSTGDMYNHYIEGCQTSDSNDKSISVAKTIPLFAGNMLRTLLVGWNAGRTNLAKLKRDLLAPTVYTTCNALPYAYNWTDGHLWPWDTTNAYPPSFWDGGPGSSSFEFPTMSSQSWSIDTSKFLAVWQNKSQSTTFWVEPPDMGSSTPSIGAVYAPAIVHGRNADLYPSSVQIVACSVFAIWEPVDLFMNLSSDNIYSPIIDRSVTTLLNSNGSIIGSDSVAQKQTIKIDVDWANSAIPSDETVVELSRTLVDTESSMGYSLNGSFSSVVEQNATTVGVAATIFLADVISRVGIDLPKLVYYLPRSGRDQPRPSTYFASDESMVFSDWYYLASNISDIDHDYASPIPTPDGTDEDGPGTILYYTQDNMTEFRLTSTKYGYIYSMEGLTRRIAAGILLVHVFVAMLYMAVVMWYGWSCNGLRSMIEILVLAINSQPSEKLNNTCAGVSRLDTYKHVIKVREVSDRRVGFVFDDGESRNTPVPGKLYGERIVRKVQTDGLKSLITEEVKEVYMYA